MEIPPPTLLDIPIIVPGEFSRNVTMAQFPFSRRMPPDREAQMVRPAPKATPMPQHEYAKIRMKQALGRLSRQHQPGEAGAGTQVGQGAGAFREQGCQLGRIPHMPPPEVRQGAFGHQIVPGVPLRQQRGIRLQPGQCFT